MSEYILPSKDLLEKENDVYNEDKKYYSLSKLILKKNQDDKLLIPLGVDKENKKYYLDLKDISGLLICGETGSGKSIFLDCSIISLLFKNTPEELKFIFIDYKGIELQEFSNLPHLITPTITNVELGIEKLNELLELKHTRINKLVDSNCKNIDEYNEKNEDKLKEIVVIIDESSEIVKSESTQEVIEKLLSNSKNAGIHIIMATNICHEDIFTKELVNSFDSKMSFDLASREQAKFINLKNSDLLTVTGEFILKNKKDVLENIQAPYISDSEIKRVIDFVCNNE
jgi:S-DNA-T family DNA segregation ATPase FtsK/SpoIIIE